MSGVYQDLQPDLHQGSTLSLTLAFTMLREEIRSETYHPKPTCFMNPEAHRSSEFVKSLFCDHLEVHDGWSFVISELGPEAFARYDDLPYSDAQLLGWAEQLGADSRSRSVLSCKNLICVVGHSVPVVVRISICYLSCTRSRAANCHTDARSCWSGLLLG